MMKGPPIEQSAKLALLECLDDVPFCKITAVDLDIPGPGGRADVVLRLLLSSGEKQILIVEAKPNGQPRLARDAVNKLLRWREADPSAYGVFVAPYISPKSAEICEREDIGFVDLSGNCRLCFKQVYIRREGRRNKFAKRRDLRSLYSPKATRVLRILLFNVGRSWKVANLADEAQVSLGQVSNVKKLLTDREWVRSGERGLRLIEPATLLAEWAENYDYRRSAVRGFYSPDKPAELEEKLAQTCRDYGIRYALTAFSAAARLAPAVRYQRASAYVVGDVEHLIERMKIKAVSSGANFSILAPYDEGVLHGATEINGVMTASPVQTYLDLVGNRGRGEEAAESLLEEVIRPSW